MIQREKRAFCVTTCNIKSISVEYVTLVTRVSPGKCRDVQREKLCRIMIDYSRYIITILYILLDIRLSLRDYERY